MPAYLTTYYPQIKELRLNTHSREALAREPQTLVPGEPSKDDTPQISSQLRTRSEPRVQRL